jgi:GDP-L-fucose synthase
MSVSGSRVLVAGGSGFLGTNLINRLVGEGVRVRATVHQKPLRVMHSAVEPITVDLRNPDHCRQAVEGMDYVFMCAANTSGAAVMRLNPLAHVTPNVVMNAQILDAAYQAGVKKFVFISSGAAYPPTGDRPVTEDEMFDGEPYDVYFSVAWMKRYAEILCRIYAEKIAKPMSTVIIRPSNVYGPYDKFDYKISHVTAALMRRVVERLSPIEVWGTGDDIRDLIYIDDFLDGMLAAVEATETHLAINICSGKGYSVKEILSTLLRVDGYTDADIRFDPSKPSTIPIRLIDGGRAKKMLNFAPKVSLEEGFRRTIQWYRANPFIEPAT